MNEEMMTTGTGGFSGSANAKGPVAGFDPVMKFRKKMAKRKKIKEDNESPLRLLAKINLVDMYIAQHKAGDAQQLV